MMYIDAVCNGIDDIPTANDEVRANLYARLKDEGLDVLLEELRLVDPQHYNVVDRKNWKRVVHALEIYYTTGKPYSDFLTRKSLRSLDGDVNENLRPFDILVTYFVCYLFSFQTLLPPKSVSIQRPYTSSPSNGVALPIDRNSFVSIL